MEFLKENTISENLSVATSVDNIYVVSEDLANHRDSDDIFIDLHPEEKKSYPVATRKIKKIKQPKPAELFSNLQDQILTEIIEFANSHTLINLKNFKTAEKVLGAYFTRLDTKPLLEYKIQRLKDALAAFSEDHPKFGKLEIEALKKNKQIKMTFRRTKVPNCIQYISINLEPDAEHKVLVYSQWEANGIKEEIIRSKAKSAQKYNIARSNSVRFDAMVWQAHNSGGLAKSNYSKALDCFERNSYTMTEFVNKVNQKSITNFMGNELMKNVRLKTDNLDTYKLDFQTFKGQSIEATVTSFATAMRIL